MISVFKRFGDSSSCGDFLFLNLGKDLGVMGKGIDAHDSGIVTEALGR